MFGEELAHLPSHLRIKQDGNRDGEKRGKARNGEAWHLQFRVGSGD